MRGRERGNIERVRQWRCCAFRSPPFSKRSPPGEGRIVTRGVRHAQRLLDVEVMMLEIKWRCALRYPLASRPCPPKGPPRYRESPSRCRCSLLRAPVSPAPWSVPTGGPPRRRRSAITTQLAPRLPAAVGSAASEVMMLGSGEFVMLLLRCCLLLMLWLLMLLLLLRPRGRTGARPMRASSPSVGANSIISSRRNVLLGCTECAVRALSEKVRGGCVHSL